MPKKNKEVLLHITGLPNVIRECMIGENDAVKKTLRGGHEGFSLTGYNVEDEGHGTCRIQLRGQPGNVLKAQHYMLSKIERDYREFGTMRYQKISWLLESPSVWRFTLPAATKQVPVSNKPVAKPVSAPVAVVQDAVVNPAIEGPITFTRASYHLLIKNPTKVSYFSCVCNLS